MIHARCDTWRKNMISMASYGYASVGCKGAQTLVEHMFQEHRTLDFVLYRATNKHIILLTSLGS
eukprot:2476489-Karenia_brevis.AAC.1